MTQQNKRVSVPVPAGVEDGQTMRMNVGKQEIYVTFRVQPSQIFRRDKEDVHSDLVISISQAILGGTAKIKGIYEDHSLRIPMGTQSHQRFCLSGKGIKRIHSSGYGDHYVYIKIKIPTWVYSLILILWFQFMNLIIPLKMWILIQNRKLNKEQQSLIKAYAELDEDANGSIEGLTTVKGE